MNSRERRLLLKSRHSTARFRVAAAETSPFIPYKLYLIFQTWLRRAHC